MNVNVRGIRVDKLSKSGFAPVITFLASIYGSGSFHLSGLINDLGVPVGMLRVSFVTALLSVWLSSSYAQEVTNLSTFISGTWRASMTISIILLIASMYLDFFTMKPVKELTRDVNRLDELLKAHGSSGGIVDMPCDYPDALAFTRDLIKIRILEIVRFERKMGGDITETMIEDLRADMREFATLLRKRFCFNIEKFDLMFEEADKIVAKEREQKARVASHIAELATEIRVP